jgi:Divergent InlB B-repeat domain
MHRQLGRRVGLVSWLAVVLSLVLGLGSSASAQLVVDPGTVINTIQTSLWTPPSPDPSGITYRPDTGELITCDGEVEEMTIFSGVNVWTHSRTGVVSSTYTTTAYSNEPTGITFDPAGGRLWISDDVQGDIHQVLFGSDGIFGTADDVITDLDDIDSTTCDDLEDVTYNPFDGHLYIASGGGQEICELEPGPNGVFDGLPPTGDDVISTFDVGGLGIFDPEGIVYDPFWNTLVVADRSTRDLYELTPEGGLLRKIDVNFPGGTKPAGVTIAPGTTNPALRNYYVVDRRVDNDADPFENDGRLFEIVAVPLGGNGAPIVDAGPPQSIEWPTNSANLFGFVGDDGHPYPPSTVAVLWSKQSGPGDVTFGNSNQPVTTATFSAPGSYVLQLVGNDSASATIDTVEIALLLSLDVTPSGPGSVTLSPPGGLYLPDTVVTLSAVPDPDAAFTGWGGALSGSANPETLTVSANTSVSASFAQLFDVAVTVVGSGGVTLSPPGGTYPSGSLVTLTATPASGSYFAGWSGDLQGFVSPEQLSVDGDKAVTATFRLTASAPGCGIGPELALLLPVLGALRRRRSTGSSAAS